MYVGYVKGLNKVQLYVEFEVWTIIRYEENNWKVSIKIGDQRQRDEAKYKNIVYNFLNKANCSPKVFGIFEVTIFYNIT